MIKFVFYLLFLISVLKIVFAAPDRVLPTETIKNLDFSTNRILVKLGSMKYTNDTNFSISEKCYEDVLYFLETLEQPILQEQKPNWAHKMLDSYGGLASGIADMNFFWLGDFQQCLSVKVMENNQHKLRFQGQYCVAFIRFNKTQETSLKVGSCFPSTCSSQDLNNIAKQFVRSLTILYQSEFCQTAENAPWDLISVTIWLFFVILFGVVIAATAFDLLSKTFQELILKNVLKDNIRANVLLAFSARRNLKEISNLNSSGEFGALHGLRVISTFWVISAHVHIFTCYLLPWKNMLALADLPSYYKMQPLFNAELAVDTFLCISGFLGVIGLLKSLAKTPKFNFRLHIFHRLWRLSPAYYAVLLFMCGPYSYFGKGPMYASTHGDTEVCREYLWKNLFYIHIYFDDKFKCMPQAWYLCVDLMLYICLLPAIVVPLSKNPAKGKFYFLIAFFLSFFIPAVLIYAKNLPTHPSMDLVPGDRHRYSFWVYEKPWGRMSCMLIGMAYGYLWHTQRKVLKFSSFWLRIIWMCAIWLGLTLMFGFQPYMAKKKSVTMAMNLFFGTIFRPLWTLLIGWVIYACATGYGGILNIILSWKGFTLLSRLSFNIYLVHIAVFSVFLASRDDSTYLDFEMFTIMIWLTFSVSILVALVLNLLIEAPFISLEKEIFFSKKITKEIKVNYKNNSQSETNLKSNVNENSEYHNYHEKLIVKAKVV